MADADADADADGRFIEFNLHKNFEMAGYEKVAIPSSHPVVFVRVSFSDMWFDMQSLYKESEVRVERERERVEKEREREREWRKRKVLFYVFRGRLRFLFISKCKSSLQLFLPEFPDLEVFGQE